MRTGVMSGIAAYLIWGLFPLYWPLLEPAAAGEILAHRMVWSLVVMSVVVTARRQWHAIWEMAARTWWMVVAASILISINWGVYIYAVNGGQVIEAALGYFINPLFSVLLGVLIFTERLSRVQWAAVGLGAIAVGVIAIAGGRFPWIAVVLAASFGLYGLVKKIIPLPPPASLTAEGIVLLIPAIAFLTVIQVRGSSTLTDHGLGHAALLALSGLVTVVPLLAFAASASALPLSILGLLQYLTPVVQFAIGVIWLHEHMPPARWIGFALVWIALLLLSIEGLRRARRTVVEKRVLAGTSELPERSR